MPERTLVLRLAAPLQSWGAQAVYENIRDTREAPTYSALHGLVRAALGHGRGDIDGLNALRGPEIVVRVDRVGQRVRDYHTVNKTPGGGWQVPFEDGKPAAAGKGKKKDYSTVVTERFYLSDAVFTAFIGGEADAIDALVAAFASPVWQLSLGRKACPPEFPFFLGAMDGPPAAAARNVPMVARPGTSTRLHHLTRDPGNGGRDYWDDEPVGPHPEQGHLPRARWVEYDVGAPTVENLDALLEWCSIHLARVQVAQTV